jgi:hypothetical protein
MIFTTAKIENGKLLIDNKEAIDVTLLNQGQADSQGYVLIDNEKAIYMINTQPDLQTSIDKLIAVCGQFTAICNTELMLGGTGSAPLKPFSGQGKAVDGIKKELEEFKLQ